MSPCGSCHFQDHTLSIYRIKGASINITVGGVDFFGSELSKIDEAWLDISAYQSKLDQDFSRPSLVSQFTGGSLWSRANHSSYSGEEKLKDVKAIQIGDVSYISFKDPKDEDLGIYIFYTQLESTHVTKLKARQKIILSNDVLEKIGTIELQ